MLKSWIASLHLHHNRKHDVEKLGETDLETVIGTHEGKEEF